MQTDNRRQVWLGLLISLISLGAIFLFTDPRAIWEALQTARYGQLAITAVGITLFLLLRAVRWRFMLNNDVPLTTVYHIQNIGYLVTNVLPLRLGDVARAVLIGNVPPVTLARGLSTMVVERVLDMLFVVTVLPFTLAEVEVLPDWMQSAARVSGILAVGAIVVLIVAANQRPLASRIASFILERLPMLNKEAWLRRLDDLLAGLHSLTRLREGGILIVLSIVSWLPILVSYDAALRAVHVEPTLAMTAFVFCAAAFSVALPSSPGQIGVFHAGVFAALQILGQPEAASASFGFLYHAINLGSMVIWGLVGVYATGATFGKVVATTRQFMQRG
ncbi:MAG: lysylphosphatidylglycerol synthase transmembrane domain-containing protein [Chloroflexota bacterium]